MNQRKASQLNGHTAIEILGVTGSFCLRERFSWVTTSSIILEKKLLFTSFNGWPAI